MKVSLKWLKDYVDIRLTVGELAERLTMAGLEVRGIEPVGGTWDSVIIGEVVGLGPHPNADRLKLATVNVGTEQVSTVCGAPNINVGQRVAFAHIGARLVDSHTGAVVVLKPAEIRGVASEGMVCSEKELGISESHEGILVLPPDAPIGVPLAAYLGDVVLDLEITPNRPDCLSVTGIAREIAALTGETLHLPEIHYEEAEKSIDSFASVDIADPDLCPRYCASLVTGIKIGPSPIWLRQRLNSYGMRPINNVVDVTNYVMLEYGQPLHAFDYHKLRGRQIIVRRAVDGETMTTLDGSQRALYSETLVIADKERAVAVAGIMGGLDSEVTDKTDTILLESANFNQAAIRRGCGRLQFQSEASIRFDKGLNAGLPVLPLKRATQLLLQLAGGKAAKGIIDIYPGKSEPKLVSLSTREVKRLSGLKINIDEITEVLTALGFECQESDSRSQISVSVPYWRSDIRCAADLVEELVRIIGYEKIPMTRLGSPLPAQKSRLSPTARQSNLRERLGNILTGLGFQEILTYSLVSLEKLQKLSPKLELTIPPLKVANPMTREQEYLRTSLRAGLLATLAYNQKFEQAGVRLFEIGKIFLPQHPHVIASEAKQSEKGKELPQEKKMLCAVLSGARAELSWQPDKELLDFFDAKGVVENFLGQLGLKASFENSDDEGLFPARRANIIATDDKVGVLGELHPRVAQAFELSNTVYLIEIDLEKLLTRIAGARGYQSIPRFPSVIRDIALVIDEQVSYRAVEQAIQSFSLVAKVTLFDLYRGEQIPEGKKSFAIRIIYQSPSHTLTDEGVDRTQEQMLARLQKELGATLRS
ncbi:MAG: phenylalanine--tRNA ligase subunit beta [Chloroflexi bacterium RBG_13_51_36]|nr:MAG: phenylalanine--tRNA ligase subunit beta [Chloroflexi bacterium RBG_13_51_36]